ncbi:hypothetical protein F2Q69_00020521 [Brassica cretica]|uniref:Uncharacterized protein n=1 Tax=Brassica cretica TaxID=69181 RepID=A0A8S9Q4Q7_BRACR|nr:hypothetical protein F2Q69_00020521 [Brassica cretica]
MMWRTSSKCITTISYRLRRLERPSGITLPSTMSRPWSAQEFSVSLSPCHSLAAYNVLLVVANGQLHVSAPGKRFDRYPELIQEAFGPRLGYWIVLPQQLLVQIASDLVYSVFAMSVFDTIESYITCIGMSSSSLYPLFEGLLGFFGGLIFSSTSYFVCLALYG